jgi:hypothetical protein
LDASRAISVAIGLLGAAATLLTTLGKYYGYQSNYDMHVSAVKALEKICLLVEFERQWFDRYKAQEEAEIWEKKDRAKKLGDPIEKKEEEDPLLKEEKKKNDLQIKGADLKTHQATFQAMQQSCDSPLPSKILQAFTLLEQLLPRDYGKFSADNATFFYHKLWKEFTEHWMWPLRAPKIEVAEKFEAWKGEYEKFNIGNSERAKIRGVSLKVPKGGDGDSSIDNPEDLETQVA